MTPDGEPGKRRYGRWSGNPNGLREDTLCCVEAVQRTDRYVPMQCVRSRGHGPHGEYCKQHAKRYVGTPPK